MEPKMEKRHVSIDVHFREAQEVIGKKGSYTVYVFRLSWNGSSCLVSRRYSEFLALHDKLSREKELGALVGPCPAKTWGTASSRAIAERIECFTTLITTICSDLRFLNREDIQCFLGIDNNVAILESLGVSMSSRVDTLMGEYLLDQSKRKREIQREIHRLNVVLDQSGGESESVESSSEILLQLETLRSELEKLALSGDVFRVSFQGNHHVLYVDASGRVLMFPYEGEAEEETIVELEHLGKIEILFLMSTGKKYIFGVEDVVAVRRNPELKFNANEGDPLEIVINPSSSQKGSDTPTVFEVRCMQRSSLEDLLGVHMKMMKRIRVSVVNHLQNVIRECGIEVSLNDDMHRSLLHRVWKKIAKGGSPPDGTSPQWQVIGFQGKDPSTDFRSVGLFGLKQLVCFVENHTSAAIDMSSTMRDYPFSCAGLNITHVILNMLQMFDENDHRLVQAWSAGWDLPFFHFLCTAVAYDPSVDVQGAIDEIYSSLFVLMDHEFVESGGTYMQFTSVLRRIEKDFHASVAHGCELSGTYVEKKGVRFSLRSLMELRLWLAKKQTSERHEGRRVSRFSHVHE
eukprot:TRINITY_DN4736_c0_g1_i1.p1 TRINITY_DN4736_c0_g1~~TRINITY_DN4736_c0_g1_i1.p1  ORF type:complete len:589 (-),score=145.33 TRINITY_DN4736_c0_g1_i1:56-1774(-)